MRKYIVLVFFCLAPLSCFCLAALNSSLFYQKLREPTPEWMKEQIEHDLKPLQKQLSRQFLDELFETLKEEWFFIRVQVVNQRLTFHQSMNARNWILS